MMIAERYWDHIKALNVDDGPPQEFPIKYWRETEHKSKTLTDRIGVIEECWGGGLTRAGVVRVYKQNDLDIITKFFVAMLWGHGNVKGAKLDHRAPYKMSECFAERHASEAIAAIEDVKIGNDNEIEASYKRLLKLNRCGPAFFTKHLYFIGKAEGKDEYPLIFDARVAAGLLAVSGVDPALMSMLSIAPSVKPSAHIDFLKHCRAARRQIGCEMDQIELFLFNGPDSTP